MLNPFEMKRISIFLVLVVALVIEINAQQNRVLESSDFAHYVEYFNSVDDEPIKNAIPNSASWDWMQENVPWFECPDKEIEDIKRL